MRPLPLTLLLAACTSSSSSSDAPPSAGTLVLTDRAAEAGVLEAEGRNRGVAAADFDGDGLLDLYTANTGDPPGLYLGRGDATFEAYPTLGTGWDTAAAVADYDADGDPDLFVACGGFNSTCASRLFRNDGPDPETGVRLVDVTDTSGIGEHLVASFGGAWADYDLDGDLDLFVGVKRTIPSSDAFWELWDGFDRPPKDDGASTRDLLFRNEGQGRFTEVGEAAGVAHAGNHHQPIWLDADHDGWPDLFAPAFDDDNVLWRNQGDGTFVDVTPEALRTPRMAFAAVSPDLDHDGDVDLVVAAHHSHAPGLETPDEEHGVFLNDGAGGFTQVALRSGLNDRIEHTGYMAVMGFREGDLDQDGWTDLFFGNGGPNGPEVNALYRSEPDDELGVRFVEETAQIHTPGVQGYPFRSHGAIFADFDEDGDTDLFVGNGGMPPNQREPNRLFLNEGTHRYGWVDVRLVARTSAPDGVGAVLRLSDGPVGQGTWQRFEHVTAGAGFNSSRHGVWRLAAGLQPPPYHLTVTWPDGTIDELDGLAWGETVEVEESE